MCEKCFDKELLRFENESEFIAFEKSLDQKANFVNLINAKDKYFTDFHYTYTCKNCNQNWWLSIPDNAWRGYFLTEQNAKKHIRDLKDSDNKKRNGYLIILFIIVIILIISIFNSCVDKNEKFDKIKWNKREDGFYLNRESMVEDLAKNYLKKGTKYIRIISLLGQPQNLNEEEENTISYELMTDFGWDIDPVEVKTLKIRISKDSTLVNWKIEHWKK